jgi:hypothetical protein
MSHDGYGTVTVNVQERTDYCKKSNETWQAKIKFLNKINDPDRLTR